MKDRVLISSGSHWEELAKYSRAVVDGEWVFVSGTVGSDPKTGKIPSDPERQTELIFRILDGTLEQAGSALEDVVRTRVFITDRRFLEPVLAVMARHFADIRPANTTIVCQLPVPNAVVEIEVTAHRGSTPVS